MKKAILYLDNQIGSILLLPTFSFRKLEILASKEFCKTFIVNCQFECEQRGSANL